MAALCESGARARSDETWLVAWEATATMQPATLRAAPVRSATPPRRRYVVSVLVMSPRYERADRGSSAPPRDLKRRWRGTAIRGSTDVGSALALLPWYPRVGDNGSK